MQRTGKERVLEGRGEKGDISMRRAEGEEAMLEGFTHGVMPLLGF